MKLTGTTLSFDEKEKIPDFLEATIFSKDNAVIMCGRFESNIIEKDPEKCKKVFFFLKNNN